MRRIVIDANVMVSVLFSEANAEQIEHLLGRCELVVPWLWRLEVTNAILVRERQKRLIRTEALRLLDLVDKLTIEVVPEPRDRTVVALAEFARPHQLTSYDAVYLDLAVRLGLPLFTRDWNLIAAAERVGVTLISAS